MRKLWFIPAIFICFALAFASAADTELDAALNADGGSIAFTMMHRIHGRSSKRTEGLPQ